MEYLRVCLIVQLKTYACETIVAKIHTVSRRSRASNRGTRQTRAPVTEELELVELFHFCQVDLGVEKETLFSRRLMIGCHF